MGKLSLIKGNKSDAAKTVLVSFGGRSYVGDPIYEELVDDNDKTTGDFALSQLKDAYQFETVMIPIPQGGEIGIITSIVGIKVGLLTNIPLESIVAELSNTSPYYIEYVRLTSGIELARPTSIVHPASPMKH